MSLWRLLNTIQWKAWMKDGKIFELDALILVTGFDAVTGSFSQVNINGLKNNVLKKNGVVDQEQILDWQLQGPSTWFTCMGRTAKPYCSRLRSNHLREPVRLDHQDPVIHEGAQVLEE
jgi:hypothetical protein